MRSRASLRAVKRFLRAAFLRVLDFGGGYAQARFCKIDTVKFGSQFEQRLVAARGHVGDDAAHDLLHVLRRLAFGREKVRENAGENPRFGCPDEGA